MASSVHRNRILTAAVVFSKLLARVKNTRTMNTTKWKMESTYRKAMYRDMKESSSMEKSLP